MKKKLEADLISIAHRILQLKNKSDINQLYLETQKLYEKLSVLRFVDEHFSEAKPTIGITEISKEIETIYDKTESTQPEAAIVIDETAVEEPAETTLEQTEETTPLAEQETATTENESVLEEEEAITEEIHEEEKITEESVDEDASEIPLEQTEKVIDASEEEEETVVEREIVASTEKEIEEETVEREAPFEPAFELSQEKEVQTELEIPKKTEAVQISFEDLLGGNYHDTLFVKKQQVDNIPTAIVIETPKEVLPAEEPKLENVSADSAEKAEPKTVSLNDKLAKGINIDLNDRLAFIKHLFGNSSEDYNRVLSQLITFDTFYETRDFVQEMVKPDYNNWEGKQDYEERFMDIIEKKFL
ncbi:hypothetical protein FLSI110296_02875 [Flavobacterium sinopsychrotolerans]|uniref:Uncharacterized protein n=1 Tax=Flavobacterium sinopsychrotolerans TaxID=604089 RepID=A0A1H8J1Y9_9FLAO|nr:hypothetical protein [Flavobacterium sinopsychrotolerans]SEN74742.1 hypothetical protein SAMN04487942_0823 [Flavobacterium sinopsychrotolerans]